MTHLICCCNEPQDLCWQTWVACEAFFGCDDDPSPPEFHVDCRHIPPYATGTIAIHNGFCYRAIGSGTADPGPPYVSHGDFTVTTYNNCDECCPTIGCWYRCVLCDGSVGPEPVFITCEERDAHADKVVFLWEGACYAIEAQVSVLGGIEVDPTIYLDTCLECDPNMECCTAQACDQCPGTLSVAIGGIDLTLWDPQAECAQLLPCNAFTVLVERNQGACTYRPVITETDPGGNCFGEVLAACPGTACSIQVGANGVQVICETQVGSVPVAPRWSVHVTGVLMPSVLDEPGFPCETGNLCGSCGDSLSVIFISGGIGGSCKCPNEVSYIVDKSRTSSWLLGASVSVS